MLHLPEVNHFVCLSKDVDKTVQQEFPHDLNVTLTAGYIALALF